MQKWIAVVGMLCSASAAAFIAYLLYDKEENEEDRLRDTYTTKHQEIRFKVPKDSIGTVIGRGGEKIKQIQAQCRCLCNFEDKSDENGARYVIIRGNPESVLEAQMLIKEIVDNEPITVEIKIPVDSVGFVIGRSGETIRSLCEASGAKVTIPRDKRDGDFQSVKIRGSFDQIEAAKAMIEEKIFESEERTKKSSNRTRNRREFHPSSGSSDNDQTRLSDTNSSYQTADVFDESSSQPITSDTTSNI